MFKAQSHQFKTLNFELETLNTNKPDRARPCKTAGILIYVSPPSMFRVPLHIYRPPRVRIPNTSARTGTQAAEKARQTPYKH